MQDPSAWQLLNGEPRSSDSTKPQNKNSTRCDRALCLPTAVIFRAAGVDSGFMKIPIVVSSATAMSRRHTAIVAPWTFLFATRRQIGDEGRDDDNTGT
jgi:hypothetical protein